MVSRLYMTTEQVAAEEAARKVAAISSRLQRFRKRRNEKLAECDWTQLADAPLSSAKKLAWAAYRQALRDVPETANADGWVTWPTKPG